MNLTMNPDHEVLGQIPELNFETKMKLDESETQIHFQTHESDLRLHGSDSCSYS